MLNLERILQSERLMRAMTGLNRNAFEKLLPSFSEAYQQTQIQSKLKRQRAPGGGHKQALPERKLRSMAEFLERFPDVKAVILDGTERPVQRPKDAETQKENYSGKKKRHTRKHLTGSTRTKRVILLTPARGGKIHDKRQLDEEALVEYIPDEVAVEGDLGFQGLQNEFDNIHLPHKKLRGKELSEQQKQENRDFSSQRVKCEHAHAGIKRYRSVTDVYRNRVPNFDDRLMLNATGLWNFYLDAA